MIVYLVGTYDLIMDYITYHNYYLVSLANMDVDYIIKLGVNLRKYNLHLMVDSGAFTGATKGFDFAKLGFVARKYTLLKSCDFIDYFITADVSPIIFYTNYGCGVKESFLKAEAETITRWKKLNRMLNIYTVPVIHMTLFTLAIYNMFILFFTDIIHKICEKNNWELFISYSGAEVRKTSFPTILLYLIPLIYAKIKGFKVHALGTAMSRIVAILSWLGIDSCDGSTLLLHSASRYLFLSKLGKSVSVGWKHERNSVDMDFILKNLSEEGKRFIEKFDHVYQLGTYQLRKINMIEFKHFLRQLNEDPSVYLTLDDSFSLKSVYKLKELLEDKNDERLRFALKTLVKILKSKPVTIFNGLRYSEKSRLFTTLFSEKAKLVELDMEW